MKSQYHRQWLDPVVALIIATVVGYHAVDLLREVIAAMPSRAAAVGFDSAGALAG